MKMAELYIRPRENFFIQHAVVDVGTGPNKSYTLTLNYDTPGWIAFDFATQIAHNKEGELTRARFEFFVNGVKRFTARGPYAFPRVYTYVDAGENVFEWKNNEHFGSSDWSKLRYINGTAFEPMSEFAGIDQETPPQTLQSIEAIPTLNGFNRYQQGSPGGVEINFQLTFAPKREQDENGEWHMVSAYDNYAKFFDRFPNFYILRYNYGLFGGTIVDPQVTNQGPLTFVDCLFHSPMKTKNDVEVW